MSSFPDGILPSRASCYDDPANPALANPDTDITGTGVLISFLATAWLTWALALVAYVSGTIPERLLNPCDRHLFRIKHRTSTPWAKTLEPLVLLLSDQQLVTGIAILVAAFARFDSINVLHWQFATAVAWMSSMTHLTTLTLLRTFFQERPRVRNWRLGGMMLLFGLLFAAEIPQANFLFNDILANPFGGYGLSALDAFLEQGIREIPFKVTDGPGVNMRCMWPFQGSARYENDMGGIMSLIFLLWSYIWKVVLLFHTSEMFSKVWLRSKLLLRLESRVKTHTLALLQRGTNPRQDTKLALLVSIYVGYLVVCDYAESFAASLLWLTGGVIYGTVHIITLKSTRVTYVQGLEGTGNSWSFGQIMSLCLLVIPLMSAYEIYESFRHAGVSPEADATAQEVQTSRHSSNTSLALALRRHSISLPLAEKSRQRTPWSDEKNTWYSHQNKHVPKIAVLDVAIDGELASNPKRFLTGADIALAMVGIGNLDQEDYSSCERSARLRSKIGSMRRYKCGLALHVVGTIIVESLVIYAWVPIWYNITSNDRWRTAFMLIGGGIAGIVVIGIIVLLWAYFKDRAGRVEVIHDDHIVCRMN